MSTSIWGMFPMSTAGLRRVLLVNGAHAAFVRTVRVRRRVTKVGRRARRWSALSKPWFALAIQNFVIRPGSIFAEAHCLFWIGFILCMRGGDGDGGAFRMRGNTCAVK